MVCEEGYIIGIGLKEQKSPLFSNFFDGYLKIGSIKRDYEVNAKPKRKETQFDCESNQVKNNHSFDCSMKWDLIGLDEIQF